MNAVVLSVGDELVSGLTVNTNAAWLSQELAGVGVTTAAHVTVSDEMEAIVGAIREAGAAGCELLLISGGLGPTEDDLTREALGRAMGEALVEDAEARRALEEFFKARQRPMAAANLGQAMRPRSARCLANSCGTAPGLEAKLGGMRIYVMPGVPREMKEMFARSILPGLRAECGGRVTLMTKINTYGMGESNLGEKIKDLMARGAEPAVGTSVHDGIVSVRIYATGTAEEAIAATDRIGAMVKVRLGPIVFGENEETLEGAAGRMLKEKGMTVATAESCTGGLVAQMLTERAGASAYFLRGWVTYSNAAKVEELGIDAELIEREGAVSEKVAAAMATRAREIAGTDFGIGITGVAGPEGGTAEKPMGTVWVAIARKGVAGAEGGVEAVRHSFPGDRAQVRLRAAQMAMARLRWMMMGLEALEVMGWREKR